MKPYKPIFEKAINDSGLALHKSLQLLEIARKEIYYDSQQDAINRKVYYKNVSIDFPDEKKIYQQLNDLLKNTHTTKLNYNDARRKYLYPRVDLQPNMMLKSIYSGEEFTPEKIIKGDFKIAEEIFNRAREQSSQDVNMNEATFLDHLAVLESDATYNAEHAVPQSWFAKKDPMKADLHHLFTCEISCNEFRENIPFFDFPDFKEIIKQGCGKKDGNRFEPSQGHGAVARATLYFLLRYPKDINNNSKEYTKDRIQMLLNWHKGEVVSQYELHRNSEIFKIQGNRNPLIDHPEWGDKVNFSLGLG